MTTAINPSAADAPEFALAQLRWYIDEHRRDTFAVSAPTDFVARITGRPAESFETTLRRYVEASSDATRTLASRPRALARLLKAMATPAPSIRSYARAHDAPPRPHAKLASDSPDWHATHEEPLMRLATATRKAS
jgi:NAD(P)H dehydrogenase (quinone)